MSQTNQTQDHTPGATQGTRSREAAMQELVTSAVGTALRPVTSRLDELRQQLDPITAHINNNTVTPSALQTHLNPMSQSLQSLQGQVDRIERRFDPLSDRLDAVQNVVVHDVGQRFDSMNQNAQATRNDVQAIHGDVRAIHSGVQAILNDVQATRNDVQTVSAAQIVANGSTANAVVSSYQVRPTVIALNTSLVPYSCYPTGLTRKRCNLPFSQ